LRRGSATKRRDDFGPTPGLTSLKKQHARRDATLIKQTSLANKHQTNKSLFARHQCHHPVTLEEQISKQKLKTEVRTNRGLLLNETQEQNSEQITMTTIGYARVSTDGQSLQSQTDELQGCGCARIFAEKISGAYSDRPQLAKALAALGQGAWWCASSIGWQAQHAICSTLSMQSAKSEPASNRSTILGQIQRHHMGG
jgi:hypothetical protein